MYYHPRNIVKAFSGRRKNAYIMYEYHWCFKYVKLHTFNYLFQIINKHYHISMKLLMSSYFSKHWKLLWHWFSDTFVEQRQLNVETHVYSILLLT